VSRQGKFVTVAVAIVLLLFLVGGAVCFLAPGTSLRETGEARAAPETLTVLYTCDTRGHIEPCSCSEGIAGGMARRQVHLASQQAPARLLVDAGNVTAGGRDWEILEARYILRAYEQMGYDAVNAGRTEAETSVEALRELAGLYDRLISANLLDASGKTIFPPYRVAELPGGYRVGILGVVEDTLAPDELGQGLTILPPEDAIAKYLPELERQSDFVVLLAFVDEERMKDLAERFYEIDVIVGGNVQQPSGTPELANRSVIAYITDKGKGVGRLDLALGPEGATVKANDIAVLTEDVPADPAIAALIEEYDAELARLVGDDKSTLHDDEEGLSEITSSRNPDADTFAGAEACRACHPQAYDVWAASNHARAFDTLARRQAQGNPDCLPCHAAGYGASDGFVSAALTPQLASVTCESCHGRGAHHVRREAGAEVRGTTFGFRTVDCVVCHDAENSPRFERGAYWEKIAHELG